MTPLHSLAQWMIMLLTILILVVVTLYLIFLYRLLQGQIPQLHYLLQHKIPLQIILIHLYLQHQEQLSLVVVTLIHSSLHYLMQYSWVVVVRQNTLTLITHLVEINQFKTVLTSKHTLQP